MLAKDIKPLSDPNGKFNYSTNGWGHFFIYNEQTTAPMFFPYYTYEAVACRELFSYMWGEHKTHGFDNSKHNMIGLFYEYLDIKNLNEIWKEIEGKLELDKKTFFYKTANEKVVIIKVSPFWIETEFKKGVFTLFLRAAAVYGNNIDNSFRTINQAIQFYALAKSVNPMLDYFLEGNTKIKEDIYYPNGVVGIFKGLSLEEIKSKLSKP